MKMSSAAGSTSACCKNTMMQSTSARAAINKEQMMNEILAKKVQNAMNRIAKWRNIYAGWQLGTRSDQDPEAQAVRDMFDKFIALRVEVNALLTLMTEKKVFSADEFGETLLMEIQLYDEMLMRRWPGAEATDAGMKFDIQKVQPWMSRFKP